MICANAHGTIAHTRQDGRVWSRACQGQFGRIGATLRRLIRDTDGTLTVIGAVAVFLFIGFAALAIELGEGYQITIANQGAADAAALAAANAYTNSPSQATLTSTADDIAVANGISASNVTVQLVNNYSASVSQAVQVTIAAKVPLFFAPIIVPSLSSYTVNVTAVAALASGAPACIVALSSSGGGINLSGGTSITANQCAVRSNASVTVSGGATLTPQYLYASNSIAVSGGASINATSSYYGNSQSVSAGASIKGNLSKQSNSLADPETNNTALNAAFAQLGQYTAPVTPSVPVGTNLTLGYYPTTMTFEGYTGTLSGNTWTFPVGTYNIANLNTGSLTLSIPSGSTVTVSGTVTIGGGGGLQIGDGNVTIIGGVSVGGGASFSLGAGTHYLGAFTASGPSATIGAGNLTVGGAINVSGGSTVTIGAGNYVIGNDGSGNAVTVAGGAALTFGNGTFSANGNVITSGGSSLTLGATATHYINGNLNLNGSATFGAGTYIINGNMTNNTGGTMTGSNVSFVLAGSLNAAGGTSINLTAPTASSGTGIPDILFATKTTAATTLGGGSQDVFSGIVYTPNSDLNMSGGAAAAGNGACFSIIANSVTLSGGTAASTSCPSLSASAAASGVGLVQ
jgi:Flp pilus assembly protein TadG